MELLPFIIVAIVFFALGIAFEVKYGSKASALNAQAHADIAAIKAAVVPKSPPAA